MTNPRKRPNLQYLCSDYEAPPESQENPYHKTPSMQYPGLANVTESEHQSKFPEEYVVPQRSSWADIPREHLTIRERYAMAAMQGMLSNSNLDIRKVGSNWICGRAWEIAEDQIQWQDYDAQKRMERAFRKEETEAGEDEELAERDVDGFDGIRRVNRTLASAREECARLRSALERSSTEHYATRVRLRDVLREAAAYAKEAADYAANFDEPESEYAKVAREDAAQYEAEGAALGIGLDTITLPPAAGETAKPARAPFRAGDIVKHGPTAEDWVLACDEFDGCVIPAGWPESVANASDCELVKATTDEERVTMLKRVSMSEGMRAARAKRQLEASAPERPAPAQPAAAATFRRRFLAGDLIQITKRDGSVSKKWRLPFDESDDGTVYGFAFGTPEGTIQSASITLIESATPAQRNRELAFRFHLWNISTDPDAMDRMPHDAKLAAQQLLRDPWEQVDAGAVPYGQVRVTRQERGK